MTKKAIVVGAGITGATIARCLARTGMYDIDVYEILHYLGGTCSDRLDLEGDFYMQFFGSHIFHTNNAIIWDFLSQFTGWLPYQHKVKSLIDGKLVPMPFNLDSIELLYKDHEQYDSLMTVLKHLPKKDYTFEELRFMLNETTIEWLVNDIFEKAFKTYSKKQWGKIPDIDVLNRVKAFRNNHEDRYFTDTYQGIPVNGFSKMIKDMLDHTAIKVISEKFTAKMTDEIESADVIFYTGSLDEFHNYKLGELPYRTCDFNTHNGPRHSLETAVINCPGANYAYTRIHDYSYYIPSDHGSITFEYPEQFDRQRHINIARFYPIKEQANLDLHQKYVELTKERFPNIIPAGRLGTYQYLNIDQACYQAMKAVDDFIKNANKSDIC